MRAALAATRRLLASRTVQWLLSAALLVAVAVGFAGSVRDQASALPAAMAQLRPIPLVAALALVLLSLLLAMAAWRVVLTGMGSRPDLVTAARIFFTGQLGTYLPGTGWPLVIQLQQGARAGVPSGRIVAAFVLSMGLLSATGLTVGLVAAPGLLGGHALWLAAPALFVIGCLVWPGGLRRLVSWLLRVVRRSELADGLSPARTRWAVGASGLSWCANGLHLWLLAVSVGAPPLRSLPACLGAMALAILLGSFLPTAPGGIGARELVLMLTLTTFLPTPAALVVTAASRLVHTVADVLPAAVALAATALRRASRPADGPVPAPAPPDLASTTVEEEPMTPASGLVSVIIPNYNGEKTLAACLDAVAAQTYPELEVIVVDDGSTDRSREIAAGRDCRLVALAGNSGPAMARNRGIAASRGEILFFLDADVALAPDAVATAVRILTEHPQYAGASGIYAPTPLFDDGPVERYQALHAHYWRRRNAGLVKIGYFSLGAFRRRVVEEVGAFDGSLPANRNEDTEYGVRIAQRYPMLLTTEIAGYHDDDHRLVDIIRKFYRRASAMVPLLLERRGAGAAQEMAHRPREIVTAALVPAAALLAPLSPLFLLVSVGFLGAFVLADPRMLRFVRAEAGLRFLPFYLTIHYVLNATIAGAALVGLLKWLVNPRFRRMYRYPTAISAPGARA